MHMKKKRLLASILFSTLATCENPLFAQVANPVTKVVDGTSYTYTSRIFTSVQDANFISGSGPTKRNQQLARKLAIAFEDDLGLMNGLGATFFWEYSGFSNFFSVAGEVWDGSLNQARTVGASTLLRNNQDLAAIFLSSAPAPQSLPIEITGNVNGGSGINLTTNLGSSINPAFQGGTLTVDQNNGTIVQNFTLDSSPRNAVDLAGNSATFSGIFSDQAGKGRIIFKNSGSPATIVLTNQSTYTGLTAVFSGVTLKIGADNALPTTTELVLVSGANLSLDGFNQSVSAITLDGAIDLGPNTLTLNGSSNGASQIASSAAISGTGSLVKKGAFTQYLSGTLTYTGETTVDAGTLVINGASQSSTTTVKPGGILGGTGTITGDVFNFGKVAPGAVNQLGTLTINGSYAQLSSGTLEIQVDGTTSDTLKIGGDNELILLGGNLNISSVNGASVTPGKIYTAIDVTGNNPFGGELGLNTNLNVVGSSGTAFVRETNPWFATIGKRASEYYSICTSSDPSVQQGCTKLQFAWLTLDPKTNTPINPASYATPGKPTINSMKKIGGSITTASSSKPATNTNTCVANGGSQANCQQQNKKGTGSGGHNKNTVTTAKTLDAGWASIGAAVTSGVTGGSAIGTTGYTTTQAKAALVPDDFATVIGALFAVPTRQQLNQALHSITAEPYASMQSVALEALEQFRSNTLALTNSQRLPFIVEEQACEAPEQSDPAAENSQLQTDNCTPVTRQKLTPWSLLIDGSNTQATLNGTNDLASFDYNIFSSSYGLQYDFNPNWSAGAAFGYGRANLYNYEYSSTRIDSDTYSGAAWGIYRPSEAWKFTALAGYMNLQYSSDRNISFGGLNRNATANWSGNGFTTALAAEYDWILSANKASRSAVRLKPRTYLSYALHNQGSFSESGAGALDLQVDAHTADSLIYGIGFSLETPIITGKTSRLIPRLAVGYEYDFNGDTSEEHQLSSSFAEAPALGSIDVLGQNRGANAVDVALSLEYETSDTLSLYGNVGGAFWSNGNEINYGAGLRLRW
ncbi:MAG: hypothetical protein RLZZ54_658 [Cyanobacteriota bacterium]|jgi:autotransporter-associated beta strand protein